MHHKQRIVLISSLILLCCCVASGATNVRVSLFVKGKSGGVVMSVAPGSAWQSFLDVAAAKLQLSAICAVTSETGVRITDMTGILDDSIAYVEACETGGNAATITRTPAADSARSPFSGSRQPFVAPPAGQPRYNAFDGSHKSWQKPWQVQNTPAAAPTQPIPPVFTHQSAPSPSDMIKFTGNGNAIGIAWKPDAVTGWGTFALQLVVNIQLSGTHQAVLPVAPDPSVFQESMLSHKMQSLRSVAEMHLAVKDTVDKFTRAKLPVPTNFPMIHALPPTFHLPEAPRFKGTKNIAIAMFEDEREIDVRQLGRLKEEFDAIIVPSTWNARVLKKYANILPPVHVVLQGVDTDVWRPVPRGAKFPGRFVIFSGGKLEYRKGQDLVIHAFRNFLAKHPESNPLLLVSWHNFWPHTIRFPEGSEHTTGVPAIAADGSMDIGSWLVANGIPREHFHVLPPMEPLQLAAWAHEADIALFPNRGEGGTNLFAMQTMAAAIPTVLSANSGHLDLIHTPLLRTTNFTRPIRHPNSWGVRHCYPLWKMLIIPDLPDWGECMMWQMQDELDRVYRDVKSGAAIDKAQAAFDVMKQMSWEKQVRKILDIIDAL